MILSDREIQAALARSAILITPAPRPERFASTSLDLTLDEVLRLWKKPAGGAKLHFCPAEEDFNFSELIDQHSEVVKIEPAGFKLEPWSFVLGWTIEKIQLPHRSRLAARVEGKSSLARLGLGVHVTAPTIHAGFGFDPKKPDFPGNPIQLEIFNLGPVPIELKKGMPICQIILEEVHGTPDKGYEGTFRIQGPE